MEKPGVERGTDDSPATLSGVGASDLEGDSPQSPFSFHLAEVKLTGELEARDLERLELTLAAIANQFMASGYQLHIKYQSVAATSFVQPEMEGMDEEVG